MTGKETSKQIIKHNQRTLSDYGMETGRNLTTIETIQKHTVSTYGMEGKNFFGRIIQRIKNLFHLSEYLGKDTRPTVDKMMESANKLRVSLNFKFKPEDLKELPTESFKPSEQWNNLHQRWKMPQIQSKFRHSNS